MRVGIIGGGLAGLAAARTLVEHGFAVDLFEATDRLGGRARTEYPADAELPIELGPEFVHGDPEYTRALVGQPPLVIDEVPDRHHVLRDGRLVARDLWQRFGALLQDVDAARVESARAYIERVRATPEDAELLARFIEGFYGARLDAISIASVAADAGGAAGDATSGTFHLRGGYGAIVERLARQSERARVHLGCPVERIAWQAGAARIVHARGSAEAERVIVTVPLGVWQAAALRCEPAIVRPSLARLVMGEVVKIVVRLREPIWDGHAPERLDFVHGGEQFPTFWMRSRGRTHLLTAWAGGGHAQPLVGTSAAALVELALDDFARATGVSRGRLAGSVIDFHFHDYANDAFSRGAYSYGRVGAGTAARELAQPVAGTLFFAGEATDVAYQGTVAGALASGARAAREVLSARDLRGPPRP